MQHLRAASASGTHEPEVAFPPMPLGEEVVNDYRFLRLSLRAHPAQFLRGDLRRRGIMRNEALRSDANGARAPCPASSPAGSGRARPTASSS